jgi:PAS domain S-box-containing protein
MKTTWKISSSRAQIATGAALLIAAFLILQIINGFEDLFAGESTQFDWNQLFFQYPRVHWLSMVVRVGMVLAVVFWSRRTINALHKNQELVRQIPETVSDGIYLVDRDGRMTFANTAVERILGVSRDVIMQRSYNDASWKITTLDGEAFPNQAQPFVRVMQTGNPVYGVEQRIQRTDGTDVIVSINAAPIRGADGHLVGEVGTVTDITERKHAEAALRNVERRYRLLFEGVSVMNVLTKPGEDGLPIIVDCNDLFAGSLGYTRAEVLGRPAGEFYTADSRKKMADGGYQRAMQGHLLTEERELLTKDGKVINTLVSAVPDIDQNGKPVGTQAMYVDITQRKYAEEQLRRSEERYKNIVENASDIIYRTDPEGRFTFCNPTSSRILKYANEEFLGQSFLDFVHPSHRKDIGQFYHEQYEKKIASTYHEFLAVAKDGSEHWIGQNVQMLKEGDNIVGYQAVARDITDRKRVEQVLAEERRLLRTLLDNLPDYIYAKDTQCRFTMANAAMAHLQGAALPEDLVGKSDSDFLPEDIAARNCTDDKSIMRSGEPLLSHQERNIDGDGKPAGS